MSNTEDTKKTLSTDDYTIGWIAILECEALAAAYLLDDEHDRLPSADGDPNVYTLGKMEKHNVVIVHPGSGIYGESATTHAVTNMFRTFPKIRFGLLVGVGGGVPRLPNPDPKNDIHLGDIVVSKPQEGHGGVYQFDMVKQTGLHDLVVRSHLNKPPNLLLNAVKALSMDQKRKRGQMRKYMDMGITQAIECEEEGFRFPGRKNDRLFKDTYAHKDGEDCSECKPDETVERLPRKTDDPVIHYGLIGSGNRVIKSAEFRNALRDSHDLMCFEMEAAGLMDNFPCLVIRGICDYSDSHKNKIWQPYAAMTAAAYARDLLRVIQPLQVEREGIALEVIEECITAIRKTIEQGRNESSQREVLRIKEKEQAERSGTIEKLRDHLKIENDVSFQRNNEYRDKRLDRTCDWLFEDNRFVTWVADVPEHTTFWLHGAPGAGKTVLCAAAIQHVRGLKGEYSTAHAYITDSTEYPRAHLLWDLASQLLYNLTYTVLPSSIPDLNQFIGIRKSDYSGLETLILTLLKALPMTFIFVDGLDEAQGYSPRTGNKDIEAYMHNIHLFLVFLRKAIGDNLHRVRLWCSSQCNDTTRSWMRLDTTGPGAAGDLIELPLNTKDTIGDIEKLIRSGVSGRHSQILHTLPSLLSHAVKGSFLLADFLRKDIEDAEDADDLVGLLDGKPPKDVDEYLDKQVRRVIDLAKGRKEKNPPTWKIILSLLTFTKRPLQKSQITEAIALIRTRDGENLDRAAFFNDDKILKTCLSVVKTISGGRLEDDPIILINDGGLLPFLRRRSDLHNDEGDRQYEQYVDSKIIRDVCLRYLMQPKYGRLLEKLPKQGFQTTHPNEEIHQHRFLSYAAKYWYRHFDTPDECISQKGPEWTSVHKFLNSPNFLTCTQFQSLYVIGHFAQSFDAVTDDISSVKRVFPNWLCKGDMFRQYAEFTSEWVELLQAGLYSEFNGELDRCFWRALGGDNFLSNTECRYHCSVLAIDDESNSKERRCWTQNLSLDRQQVVSCHYNLEQPLTEISVDKWMINYRNEHGPGTQHTVRVDVGSTQLDLYRQPCSSPIPLIPSISCLAPPDGLSINQDASAIRVGSKLFFEHDLDKANPNNMLNPFFGSIGDYWEDICARDDILVSCRRRVPKAYVSLRSDNGYSDSSSDELEYESNPISKRKYRFLEDDEEEQGSPEADMKRRKTEEVNALWGTLSAEESWSDTDSAERDDSIASSSLIRSPPTNSEGNYPDDFDLAPNMPLDMEEGRNDDFIGNFAAEYAPDPRGPGSDSFYDGSNSSLFRDSTDSESIYSDISDSDKVAACVPAGDKWRILYPIAINNHHQNFVCDTCGANVSRRRYYCTACKISLCRTCVGHRRQWCSNKDDLLFDYVNDRAVDAISRPKFLVELLDYVCIQLGGSFCVLNLCLLI